jgi:transforming growth factor-beta-induced protein
MTDTAQILAPSDSAFRKNQDFNVKDATMVREMVMYHMLAGKVTVASVKTGESVFVSTTLTDPAFTNVTKGQNVIINKQPAGDVVITSGLASRTTVLASDIAFSGGLIQVIDSMMVAPASLEKTARDAYTDLSAFVGALYSANLIDEFVSAKDITLFVPRAAAFQQLAGTFSSLDSARLAKILRYHLVPGTVVPNSALQNSSSLKSAAGPDIKLTRFNNNVYAGAAQLIQTDILITNGVVQMVDNVLDPDRAAAVPNVDLATQPPLFTPVPGQDKTGSDAPTPFTSALPCTADCPVATKTGGVKSSSSKDGVAGPRCTGVVGMVGAGIGVVGGVWGMMGVV